MTTSADQDRPSEAPESPSPRITTPGAVMAQGGPFYRLLCGEDPSLGG